MLIRTITLFQLRGMPLLGSRLKLVQTHSANRYVRWRTTLFASNPICRNGTIYPARAFSENISNGKTEKILVYEGPLSSRIRMFKATASMLGLCAIVAAPSLVLFAKAPLLLVAGASGSAFAPLFYFHWLTRKYVTKLYVYDNPKNIVNSRRGTVKTPEDLRLVLEICNLIGFVTEIESPIADLEPGSKIARQPEIWVTRLGKRQFFLEPLLVEHDSYLRGISERISAKGSPISEIPKPKKHRIA